MTGRYVRLDAGVEPSGGGQGRCVLRLAVVLWSLACATAPGGVEQDGDLGRGPAVFEQSDYEMGFPGARTAGSDRFAGASSLRRRACFGGPEVVVSPFLASSPEVGDASLDGGGAGDETECDEHESGSDLAHQQDVGHEGCRD